MTNTDIAPANAPAGESGGDTKTDENISSADLVNLFSQPTDEDSHNQGEGGPSASQEEETTQASGDDANSQQEDGAPQSALEKYGLADASEEELIALSKEMGGRLGPELGKLRQEVRDMQSLLKTEQEKKSAPFERKPTGENPYSKISDKGELEQIYNSALDAIKKGKRALDRNSDSSPDEVILKDGDNELTRAEVEQMVDTAEDARDFHVSDRLEELKKGEEQSEELRAFESARERNLQNLPEIHEWAKNPPEEFSQIRDSIVDQIRDKLPSLLPQIDLVLADHFAAVEARLKSDKKPNSEEGKRVIKSTPPSGPGSAVAPRSRPATSSEKRSKFLDKITSSGQNMSSSDLMQFLQS